MAEKPMLPKRIGRDVRQIELPMPDVQPPPLADLVFVGASEDSTITREQLLHMERVTGHHDISLDFPKDK
jgi:hypothetical protein